MSRKPEQRLWDLLRTPLRAAGLRPLRVENVVDDGFPDIIIQGASSDVGFIETKARPDVPRSPGSLALGAKYGLRTSQRNWWLEYWLQNGRRGMVVSRVGTLVYAHSVAMAEEINRMTFAEFCDEAIAAGVAQVVKLASERGDWE